MKVILLKDVKGQGKKDQIIDVSDGYANNFLIKNKFAVPYSKTGVKKLENELDDRAKKEEKLVEELTLIKNKLNNKEIKFKVAVGKDDKVFGTVSNKQINESIHKLGFKIDKKCIQTNHDLNTLGVHLVDVKLHNKVSFKIKIVLEK